MLKTLSIAVAVSLVMQQAPAPAVPKTTATTPAGCLQEVRDYAAKRQQEMIAATAPIMRTPGRAIHFGRARPRSSRAR